MPPPANLPSGFEVLHGTLEFRSAPKSSRPISSEISNWLRSSGAMSGTLTVFCQHTSASLTIQENYDPTVQEDLLRYLDDIAPENRYYEHSLEGPDDMPAHLKTLLTSVSLTIPVQSGAMALGQWQGVYLLEHRAHSHSRRLHLTFTGFVKK
ncbi:secondary thiamine-phosphate synthase enzyme YjbQ [uncultured Cohaesibacter sp.]|uniref:secondary thiamine-phosphate synthase enzyme YjbQ n=1 Tax=uncultured Cohaesibacter sp. TaxID=1002546 RepID=UPI002931CCE9|nr:secondary thiamine-phosphate synthase enzyme YjbQ [uncultured Cohaesibacter sp.]